jgi:protein TonB
VLHGTIGKDGVIRELKVVRGDPMLSAAALDAVQQWRYDPYKRDGSPIEMPIDITIDFNLNK